MRSKIPKKLLLISTLVFCFVIVSLFINQKLNLYIHPRYDFFTVGMTFVALILLITSWFGISPNKPNYTWLLVFGVSLISLVLPPATLTNYTASSRTQNSNTESQTNFSTFDSFSQDFSRFTLQDWHTILLNNNDKSKIAGKNASIDGFYFINNENQGSIARFKVSCCAVDATPLSVPIVTPDSISLVENNWYKVEGIFILEENENLVLSVTLATQISEPEQPYVY